MDTMNNFKKTFALLMLGVIFFIGCGNDSDDNSDENILLEDQHNYSFTGVLNIPVIETACAENAVDIVIDWSNLITDLQYHAMNPATDIDNVMLIRVLDLEWDEIEDKLSSSELDPVFLDGYLNVTNDNDQTSALMNDMTMLGEEVPITEHYIEDDHKYLLLLATGLTPGTGARMLTFLDPKEDSQNTLIEIGSFEILDFSADVTSLTPVDVPEDGPWVMDWSGLDHNGQGNPLVSESIDGVMLGFYEGETAGSLEGQVLDLELIADQLYELGPDSGGPNLGSKTFDLADLDGFSGFEGDGVWIFGLTCSMCQNPAPLFLTVLNPV